MKDIPIPSSRRQASQLSCHFPLRLFSYSQSEDAKRARFPASQSLHCRGRIMDARVYEVGMQTRPVAVARKRNESPFYSVDKIDTTRRGPPVCRREKGRRGPRGWMDGWNDEWTGIANTVRWDFQGFLPSLLPNTVDSRC